MQIEQIGIGQLHWSTANYAPLQERALWDGLVAMYDKVSPFGISICMLLENGYTHSNEYNAGFSSSSWGQQLWTKAATKDL